MSDEDCLTEDGHLWEKLPDGSRICVWCGAVVRRVGE